MKKLIKSLILMVVLFSFHVVFAASANISISSTSAYVGDAVTVTVNCFAGAWNLSVSGAVSDSIVGYDMNGNVSCSKSYTLTSNSPGTQTVYLSGDVTDYNTDVTSNAGGSVSVTFNNRPAPPPPGPSPSPSTNPGGGGTPAQVDNRSSNANLKSIGVEGFELTKVDETHFTLSVKHSVDRVTLKAEVEDSKAKVDGIGAKELKEGENAFEVVITAENGATKTYVITITRRSTTFTLDQIKDAIADSEDSDVDLVIGEKTTLTEDDLKAMKESKKTFHITKYDEDKKVVYSWTIFGNSIKKIKEFDTNIEFKIKDRDAFEAAMEYVDGLLVSLKENVPDGSHLKISVKDKFSNGSKLHLFSYVDGKRKGSFGEYDVINGFVEFPLKGDSVYFLTKASFEKAKEGMNVWTFICIGELFIIIVLFLTRGKKKKKANNDVKKDEGKKEDVVVVPSTQPVMDVVKEETPSISNVMNTPSPAKDDTPVETLDPAKPGFNPPEVF